MVLHFTYFTGQPLGTRTLSCTKQDKYLPPSSHIPDGLNCLFPDFERAMLFDETLIEVFDTDIGFKRIQIVL